jgi:DNA polymerase-3 subunit chi
MARVNFYLLTQPGESARRLFACRLAEKLWRQGLPVQVHAASRSEAEELDALLWQFSPESFVPHCLHEGSADPAPAGSVLLSWGSAPLLARNLLQLGESLPAGYEHCDTIAEFVSGDAAARTRSRALWQQYRQAGHDLQHHQIGA